MNPMTNLAACEPCLPPPPPSVVNDGELASGRYAGRIARIDWSGLRAAQQRSAWWRRCHHKRWQYVGLAAEHWFIGLAIVDLGWAMPATGWFELHGQRHVLQGATGSLDSSNGLLVRETAWRWASAHDRRLGFNLQQGYFGNQENVLWLDGALLPLGAATFVFDPARPLAPWHIHTDDGLLDLRFRPEGARQARRDVWIAASDYIQPVGTFHGWVRAAPGGPTLPVEGLLGVTEDHRSRW